MVCANFTKNEKYEYKVKNDEITIIKYLGKETNILVPSRIDGLPVTTIEDMAFYALDARTGDSKMILSVPNSKADGYGYWNSANKVIMKRKLSELLQS